MTARPPKHIPRQMGSRLRRPAMVSSVTAGVLWALYGGACAAADDEIGEIIVTATRHAVSAQDVPASITAISGESLDNAGIKDIAGLAHSVAGVNYVDKGPYGGTTGSTLVIRGLNSEDTSNLAFPSQIVAPVATYVDETPLFANIRLLDLDHVEILRGPQGTLYGSGSLGGTIRFVQNAPDPKAFDARVEVGLSDTQHSHATNQDVSGILNLPISETMAVRINAGFTNQAGFINQPNLFVRNSAGVPLPSNPNNLFSPAETIGETGTNSYGYRNARLAFLWKPNEDFRAQISYYYQRAAGNGYPYSSAPYGFNSLTSIDYIRETTDDSINLVALTLSYDLGFATLTSATSGAHHTNNTVDDGTAPYQDLPFYQAYYGANPRAVFPRHTGLDDKLLSQEVRLASTTGGRLEWVAGVFFNDERTHITDHDSYPGYNAFYNACAPIYGAGSPQCGAGEYGPMNDVSSIDGIAAPPDLAYVADFETHFTDLAIFGEMTWNVTSAWSVTGGARLFKQTIAQSEQIAILFDGPDYANNSTVDEEFRRALWKLNTAYKLDSSNLVYATWSQGFRRGSANALPAIEMVANYVTPPALTKVEPDTANNYEIGIKGTLQNRYRYSAAIYDVLWKNIQQSANLTPLELTGAINVGNGYSRGIETEQAAVLTNHITAQFGYTYDETRLTALSALAAANLYSPPAIGSQLPGTPRNNVSLDLEYGHVKIADGELRFAVDGHYQSSLIANISSTVPPVHGYSMFDARTSFTRSHWIYTLYLDNLTNQIGINSYTDPGVYGSRYAAIVSRPRTVGITIGYSLKGI
jgi:iron complex outermembrane recepter protein